MTIGKVWIYLLLFVCKVTDFSAEDKASGITVTTHCNSSLLYPAMDRLLMIGNLSPSDTRSLTPVDNWHVGYKQSKPTDLDLDLAGAFNVHDAAVVNHQTNDDQDTGGTDKGKDNGCHQQSDRSPTTDHVTRRRTGTQSHVREKRQRPHAT